MIMTGNLVDYLGPLPTFGMPYLFVCTDLIINLGAASMGQPIRISFHNNLDLDDAIIFQEI